MNVRLIAFGIAKDIIGSNKTVVEIDPPYKLTQFREYLFLNYPEFKKLQKISFAVDQDYQLDSYVLSENQEVVIIPPVSGG